jgi:hypothetical protein
MLKRKNIKGRGKGYDWDKGKSNNALSAEDKGLLLAGAIANELKCSTEFVQDNAPYEEWHHVSGWFNKKRYFKLENVQKWWSLKGEKLWEMEKAIIESNLAKTGSVCTIRFNEWKDRKTVYTCECKAYIIKQGKKISTLEIKSDVWYVVFSKSDSKYIRFEKNENYKIGDQIKKKIEFVE